MKLTTLYLANGMAMLAVFLACRILIFPFMYLLYAHQIGHAIANAVILYATN